MALVCGFLFFWRLGSNGIFDLDEGLYVAAAREMNLHSDFITPRVNGSPFFEKPPLIYWLSAASMSVLGTNELAARLPSAIATLLTALMVLGFGARHFGRRAGLLAALMFALSPIVFGEARQLTTDATLNLCITAALFSFFRAYFAESNSEKHWYYGFWTACGFGVLAKGLPGILIPWAVGVLFIYLERQRSLSATLRAIARTRIPSGLLLFLLITAPWHYAAWKASGPAFTQEYVIRQHIGRFRGGDEAHRAPVWFYVPGFLLGMFPWSFFVPAALLNGRNNGKEGQRVGEEAIGSREMEDAKRTRQLKAHHFQVVWACVVFVMFSLSGSKLVSYILPMYAPAALLAGNWCVRAIESEAGMRRLTWIGLAAFGLSVIVFLAALMHARIISLVEAAIHKPIHMDQIPPQMIVFAIHLLGAAALALGIFFLWILLRKSGAISALILAIVFFFGIAIVEGLTAVDSSYLKPLHRLAALGGRMANQAGKPLIVSSVPRRPSALFYLPDSLLQPGVMNSSHVLEPKPDALVELLPGYPPSVILTDSAHAMKLLNRPGLRILESDGGWSLVDAP